MCRWCRPFALTWAVSCDGIRPSRRGIVRVTVHVSMPTATCWRVRRNRPWNRSTQKPGPRPPRGRRLAVEAENLFVGVRPPQVQVGDEPGGDHAERNAVAAVAESKVRRRMLGMFTDERQAILGFAESAGPGIGRLEG